MILESSQRIADYNAKGLWQNRTLDAYFKQNLSQHPDFIALIDPLDRPQFSNGEVRQFTYTELNHKVNQLTCAFSQHGLGKDDIIGIFLPNIWELIVSYLAIARIGGIANPYPPSLREFEIEKMGAFAGISAMVTTSNFKGRNLADIVRNVQNNIPSLKHLFTDVITSTENEHCLDDIFVQSVDEHTLNTQLQSLVIDPNDIVTLCWTSGTTGMPKGVPRSHNLWDSIAYACTEGANIMHDDVFLCPFPIVNMGGIGGCLVPWLQSGCQLILHQPFDISVFLKQITTHQVTYTLAPPAILTLLLKNPTLLENVDISSLRVLGSGSAPLTPWLIETWFERHNIQVTNFFGSNEGAWLLSAPNSIPNLAQRATYFPAFGADASSYANVAAAKGMETKLVDIQSGKTITDFAVAGELCVKGPSVFSGYFHAPEVNQQAFDDEGFFKTGDVFELVMIDGNQYYRFIERCKDIIIRGGFNIAPADVESLLVDMPKLVECAVVGYPDEILGERLALFAVVKEGETLNLKEIIQHLQSKKIASYKLPEQLVTITQLPRNPVGKILRRELRAQLEHKA